MVVVPMGYVTENPISISGNTTRIYVKSTKLFVRL